MLEWLELLTAPERAQATQLARAWRSLKSTVAQRLREADDLSVVEPRLAPPRSSLHPDIIQRFVIRDVQHALRDTDREATDVGA